MELIFVRHGETEFNKHHQLMGQRIDAPLDEEGEEQARQVINKLPPDFTAIYSSPLKRAAHTAQIIAAHFNKEISIREELTERDFGSLSGKTWDQIDREIGQPLSEQDKNLAYDYRPYGGESAEEVKARFQKFLEEMKARHNQKDVVIAITHYGIISIMESLYPTSERHKLTNISVHKFHI